MNKIPERYSNIKELNALVQVMLQLALVDIRKQGVNPLVVETYRDQIRQNYLYCQKRTIAEAVAKGISPAFAEAYCNPNAEIKATDTLSSLHTLRKAVDIVPQRVIGGKIKAIWDRSDKQTQIIIKTMTKYGFEAGANWKTFIDSPHFQVEGSFASYFNSKNTTAYVTRAIQAALGIVVDGSWGAKTTDAVNSFRKVNGWSKNGKLGPEALKVLLSRLA